MPDDSEDRSDSPPARQTAPPRHRKRRAERVGFALRALAAMVCAVTAGSLSYEYLIARSPRNADRADATLQSTDAGGGGANAAPSSSTDSPASVPSRTPPPGASRPSARGRIAAFDSFVFPTFGGGSVVLVRQRALGEAAEVRTLPKGRAVAEIAFPEPAIGYAVSSRGDVLARLVGHRNVTAEIWSVAEAKKTASFKLGPATMIGPVGLLEGRLIVRRWVGIGSKLETWDVAKGERVRSRSVPGWMPGGLAASPAGDRLALVADRLRRVDLVVYDLSKGRTFDAEPLTEGPAAREFVLGGVAFSPDGEKISALYKADGSWRLTTWHILGFAELNDHELDDRVARYAPDGRHAGLLSALPRGGWLVFGSALVDGKTGRATRDLRIRGAVAQRVIDAGHVAVVTAEGGRFRLETAEVERNPKSGGSLRTETRPASR